MNCHDADKLKLYVYRLLDEAEAREVTVHLSQCARCRAEVEQHQRLDTLLGEWKAPAPTPGFDARVRQRVEAEGEARAWWAGLWRWDWAHGLALASVAVLVVAGAVWFAQSHFGKSSTLAARRAHPASSASAQVARVQHPSATTQGAGAGAAPEVQPPDSPTGLTNDDKDTQALEDYDLAANFDLLSELPRGAARVAN